MNPNNSDLVLKRVIEYGNAIINNENCPSDDHVQTCEEILEIIRECLEQEQ